MRSRIGISISAAVGVFWLAGCGRADPTLLPPDPLEASELRIESVELLQLESWPVQIQMVIAGTLPSECHTLDYAVILPGADRVIEVEAQAVIDEPGACSGEEQPFRQSIGLGSYTDGSYQVLLNGEQVEGFQLGSASQAPGSGDRGPVFIDEVELVLLESYPVQLELLIRGALPTPCASLEWTTQPPDELGRIYVEVFSLQDPSIDCIQVLENMDERLPIGSYGTGSYSVWLNGELVGEFEV